MLQRARASLITILISGAFGSNIMMTPRRMTYAPGIHLVKLPEFNRQFLLAVPRELASNSSIPLVVGFHGWSDSPWYFNRGFDMSTWLDLYGWLGIFPFGLNEEGTNGLDGIMTCCPPACDEHCCKNALRLEDNTSAQCRWRHDEAEREFIRSLVGWAEKNVMADITKVFATGFSDGAILANELYCKSADLFRVIAPISGDSLTGGPHNQSCQPTRPVSYITICGSVDDAAKCQYHFRQSTEHVSRLNSCQGQAIEERMSATTTCKKWLTCKSGTFVEWCETVGLAHEPSGGLRPDGSSYLRPGSDLNFVQHMMQKFSLFAGDSILFYNGPQADNSQRVPHDDHPYFREGKLLGHDMIV